MYSTAPEIVRPLVDRPEALVAERDAVDVAEQHRAGHAELRASRARIPSPTPPGSLSGSVASAVKWCPRVSIASLNSSLTSDASLTAVAGVSTCVPGVVSVTTWRRDAVRVEHLLPVREVAMAADGDVVVARDSAGSGCRRYRSSP